MIEAGITVSPDGRTVNIAGEVATRLADGVLKVWEWRGRKFASGLGTMYVEQGFPLSMSFDECARRGWTPCLKSTVHDMMACGMDREKAEQLVRDGLADMTEPKPEGWPE